MIALLATALLLLQAIISVHTELVVVPAVVTDSRGAHVTGLTADNFHVFENGRPQAIVAFQRGEAPLTVGVIVDRSQSMRPKNAALHAAVAAILESSRPDDELFAVAFNDRVTFALGGGQAFTHDVPELERAVTAVRAEGQTALYDAVAEGLQQLRLGRAERHALVIVSDGGDNASRRKYSDILALARQSDAVIYAIGLLSTAPAEEFEDPGLLKRLCKDTGGVAYFPRTDEEIAAASSQVALDLREQYTLGFAPGERSDKPTYRKIEVTATAPGLGPLHVRTRPGYMETP